MALAFLAFIAFILFMAFGAASAAFIAFMRFIGMVFKRRECLLRSDDGLDPSACNGKHLHEYEKQGIPQDGFVRRT